MYKFIRFFVFFFFGGLFIVYTPITWADYQPQKSCYGSKIGNKALSAFANLTTSVLEVPKNIINTSNQSNIFYGIAGGFIKGIINTAGRTGVGIVDLITLPIPTIPIAEPVYIWDNFDADTRYNAAFRLDQTTCETEPTFVQAPRPPLPVVTAPAMVTPMPVPIDNSKQYSQETDQKLNTFFKQEMMK